MVVTRLTPLTGTATLALVHPVDGNKVGFAGEAAAVEGGVLWFTAQGMLKGVKLEGGEEVRSVVLHAKSNWTCGELHVSGADLHASCLPPGEEPSGGKRAVHDAVGRAKGNRRGLNPGGPSCGCAKTSRAVTEGPWTYWPMATDVGLTIVRLGPQLHALPSPLPRLAK